MSDVTKTTLPRKFHDAVVRWRDTFIPDFDFLQANWERYFPNQPLFELCAYRDAGVCPNIEVGDNAGQAKFCRAKEMSRDRAEHLLKAVRAQASTELGSIQQHRLTLARAREEQDQMWILRMMAEELRHGYQMFHLLLDDDWKAVSDTSGEQMVEEVLNMRTGSHVLGAFNVDFDSFLDNAVFCCLIDRVGKYQLEMQKVSAYRPMAESMPPMLREEAFHLAAGVTPLRRWVVEAAKGEGTISVAMIQKALHKWFPRGLDMFGDERGGGSNVRMGFKPMKNGEAQAKYAQEVEGVVRDLNERFVQARLPHLDKPQVRELVRRVADEGEVREGIRPEDLLRLPDVRFFRRRGVHAYQPFGVDGTRLDEPGSFQDHLLRHLPEAYAAGRDLQEYLDWIGRVARGEKSAAEAVAAMPRLSRVGGACPCSNAVRWVQGADGA